MATTPTRTIQELRKAGLRVTAHRFAVLEWLDSHPHATADEIGAGVQERMGSISTQTVYNVLAACVEAGLVRHIEPAGHPARFERRAGDNHHHLVCRTCGAIVDTDCAVAAPPCLAPDEEHGFDIDEAEVVFWGRCRDCRASGRRRQATATEVSNDARADGRPAHLTAEV